MALLPGFYIVIWGASMFVAGLVFYWLALRIRQLWNGPPGIFGFPFIGSSRRTHSGAIRQLLFELQNVIGSVYHLYIRSQYVVVVSEYNDFLRAFRENDKFLRARHATPFSTAIRSTPLRRQLGSLICAKGSRWEIISRFVRTTLYECVFDPDTIQIVSKSSRQLTSLLKLHPVLTRFGLQKLIGEVVLELVASLIIGVRYAHEPENISNLSRFMQSVDPVYATGSYSTKRFRTCGTGTSAKFQSNLERVKADINQEIWMQTRSKQLVSGTFCSAYLRHLEFVRKFIGRTIEKLVFSEEELIKVAVDLLIASYFPLFRVLHEGILHLARQSAAQEKALREVNSWIATTHLTATCPQEFGKNCPYVTATYCEILRLTSVAQPGACRKAVCAFQLGAYTIARGALVVADLEAIHRNEKQWTKPEDFRPDRFIDEAGVLRIPQSLVPFSLGERSCPGGHLSSVIIPRMLIGLLTNFKITVERPPDGMSNQAQLLTFHPIQSAADTESMSETSSTYL